MAAHDRVASPCVSVIVTTFNRAALLSQTINSILGQTYSDFELIVVDNMSTDDTEGYVGGIPDARVRYFRNPNHGVIAINRNFGIQHARGRYIAFCDDDDLWMHNKLDRQVAIMERNLSLGMCYSNAESFSDRITIKKAICRRVYRDHLFHLLRGNYIPNSSVLIRKSVFDQLGMLTIDRTLREDYQMWLRIARSYPLFGIDVSLIRYRVHPQNVAGNKAVETLRAIRSVRSVIGPLGLAWLPTQLHIAFQFAKYCTYVVMEKKTKMCR